MADPGSDVGGPGCSGPSGEGMQDNNRKGYRCDDGIGSSLALGEDWDDFPGNIRRRLEGKTALQVRKRIW